MKALENQKKLFPNGIPECGTDALRFTLCSHNTKSHFINFDVSECQKNSLFCNKIWQSGKFVMKAVELYPESLTQNLSQNRNHMKNMDLWILSRLAKAVQNTNKGLENADLNIVTSSLKTFLYYDFCDTYLESTKPVLRLNVMGSTVAATTLIQCFQTALQCLCPLMPFVSEEVYQFIPKLEKFKNVVSITETNFPSVDEWNEWRNEKLEDDIEDVINIVTCVRRFMALHSLTAKTQPKVMIKAKTVDDQRIITSNLETLKTLTRCEEISVSEPGDYNDPVPGSNVDAVGEKYKIHFTTVISNLEAERKQFDNFAKREKKIKRELEKLFKFISHKSFQYKEISKQEDVRNKITSLEEELSNLKEVKTKLKVKLGNSLSS